MPAGSELDGIAHEICDHLPDSTGVSHKARRDAAGVLQNQVKPFVFRLGRKHLIHFFDYQAQVKGTRLNQSRISSVRSFRSQLSGVSAPRQSTPTDNKLQTNIQYLHGFDNELLLFIDARVEASASRQDLTSVVLGIVAIVGCIISSSIGGSRTVRVG